MVRLFVALVIAAGLVQVAMADDGPPVDQPMPADRATIVQPSETTGRVAVRSETVTVLHVSTANKLPAGAIAAIDNAFPGGTIVDVDKGTMGRGWDVRVVDRQGLVYKGHVDNDGKFSHQKAADSVNDRIAKLPESVRQSVMQHYPNAVIFDTERTVENGKKAYEVEILNDGQRLDVKLHHSSGEILEIESDKDDVAHD